MGFLQDYQSYSHKTWHTYARTKHKHTGQVRGHPPIITPFTPHMCDFQGHCANIVNIAVYPYDHIRM